MPIDLSAYQQITALCREKNAILVAVSKTKPLADIRELYEAGQRDFGENYVQELLEKQGQLPADIRWHFIGHLQSNKVKQIAPFVHLVHGVDSVRLLQEINKQGLKLNRRIRCLLQVHIAQEETKFGFDEEELKKCLDDVKTNPTAYSQVEISGLMGMASFSRDEKLLAGEFGKLRGLSEKYLPGTILSMGMSGDYKIALNAGSNMLRIGSMLFGAR